MSGNRPAFLAVNEQNKVVVNRKIVKTHWIELDIRDEHNKPFTDITGILTDSAGDKHKIDLNDKPPLRVKGLPPGKVTFEFDDEEWLPLAQARKERTEQEKAEQEKAGKKPPVEAYAADEKGYECTEKQYLKVTTGDLTELSNKDALPKRHRKVEDDNKLSIELDNSYVLEVKGYNYLTMRLGMFFDGTTNNTYSAEWGKTVLDDYSGDWIDKHEKLKKLKDLQKTDPKEFTNELFEFPSEDSLLWFDKAVTGSAANELTNVEKMKRLYYSNKIMDNTYIDQIYVTGIGTGNDTDNTQPADESAFTGVFMGQGLGGGPYGILSKVTTAIESIGSNLDSYLTKANEIGYDIDPKVEYDGIGKFEFDVFGFSRGSAAARHFINMVLDGEDGDFAEHIKEVCEDNDIILDPSFKWTETEKDKLIIKFVGLFDTVASVLDVLDGDFAVDNAETGKVRLWLDPAGVEKVVHLTAHKKTEYRKNFCLNKLNEGGSPGQFEEHELPGAHSDLGGGYHSMNSFEDKSYYLPFLENKVVFETWEDHKNPTKEGVNALLSVEVDRLKDKGNGWGDIFKREIHLHTDNDYPDRSRWHGKLFVTRTVKGDLSRLYLRVMHGLAHKHKVPVFSDELTWEAEEHVISDNFNLKNRDLNDIAVDAYNAALDGKVLDLLKTDDFREALVGQSFVHHSAEVGITHAANGNLKRRAFKCEKGK